MFKQQRHQHDLRHREQRRPPHQHQGIKRAVAFRQDVGHRESEGCSDHKQQRKRVCRQARLRCQHDHADECNHHAGGRGERRPLREQRPGQQDGEGRGELIGDGRHASRAEPKADIEQPEVQSTKENRNSRDRAELSARGPFDERNKQQRDGQEAQCEEEERRKLRYAHFDGHELITPEQGNGHRADDLDGRHGILPFKTDQSRYRRAGRGGVHGLFT